MSLRVRPFAPSDAPDLTAILNAIIAAGGTTAYQRPFTVEGLRADHLDGPTLLSCHVVLTDAIPVGFQSLNLWPDLPPGWADIATFTCRARRVPGAGAALFPATVAHARGAGIATIRAAIRADNAPGLAYYARLGFRDVARLPAVPLDDGTPVDRVLRRFDLA